MYMEFEKLLMAVVNEETRNRLEELEKQREKELREELEKLEKMLSEKEEIEEKYAKETKRNENYEPLFVFGTCAGVRQVNTRALGRPNRCMYTRKG